MDLLRIDENLVLLADLMEAPEDDAAMQRMELRAKMLGKEMPPKKLAGRELAPPAKGAEADVMMRVKALVDAAKAEMEPREILDPAMLRELAVIEKHFPDWAKELKEVFTKKKLLAQSIETLKKKHGLY